MNKDVIPQIQQEIETLQTLQKGLANPSQQVEDAQIKSPISSVENSLSKFVQDSFDVTRQDFEFNQALQAEILSRLPDFKNSELIALLTNNKVNDNDRISKILAPTFQLMTAKQQAEIAAYTAAAKQETAVGTSGLKSANMRELNESVSKEILQGMNQLKNMLDLFSARQNATEADIVKKD